MPLDPNIALSFRLPQAEQPFQTMGGMLSLRSELMKQDEAQRQQQSRIAFENEIKALPESERTTENMVKIASKYAPAKELLHYGQQSLDRNAQIGATKELGLAKIAEANRFHNAQIADMFGKTQDRGVQQKLLAIKQASDDWARRAKVYYDTGQGGAVGAPPDVTGALMQIMMQWRGGEAPGAVPQQPQSAAPQQPRLAGYDTAPQPQAAPGPAAGGPNWAAISAEGRAAQPQRDQLAQAVIRSEGGVDPAAQQGMSQEEWSARLASNMDARDLRDQSRYGQPSATAQGLAPAPTTVNGVPQVAPQPVAAPAQPIGQGVPVARAQAEAASMSSQMPPEVQKLYDAADTGKAKAKIKAQWEAGVVKAEIERVKKTQGGRASEETVKAIAEGRMPMPTGWALRSEYWQDVVERVAKIDPNFDASRYGARAAARRTFASGPEARNVTALNTVIGHLGTLDEAAQALNNNNFRVANAVFNRMATEIGDPRVQNFDTAKQAVAEETMRVFRQVGASEREAREWGERITSSGSPAQLRGVISTLGQLLDSRVEAIAQQYERTVNQKDNPAKVDPKNRAKLDQLIRQGKDEGWSDEKERRYQELKKKMGD